MLLFSKAQRNGLIVLAILIVLSLLTPYFLRFLESDYSSSFSQFEKEIENSKQESSFFNTGIENKALFVFNPNHATSTDFQLLGLNPKQIKQILNFREKVDSFRTKRDFAKIYAIDSLTFARLKAYIDLPDSIEKEQKYANKSHPKTGKRKHSFEKTYEKPKMLILELNSASEEDLQELKGIGATLSKRIVKYRNALGGFISKSQLTEVYGIEPELVLALDKNLFIGNAKIKVFRLNFITAKALETHPYFGKDFAKKIVKERTFNGRFKNLQDFQKRLKVDDVLIEKIKAYIQF
jgi:DNA uptake protein ComE-like DNA-binding protein